MQDNCERIVAALSGECAVCGWHADCLCVLCIEHADVVRYRCPVCLSAYSRAHDIGYTRSFEGTRDGTAYGHEHYGKTTKKEV